MTKHPGHDFATGLCVWLAKSQVIPETYVKIIIKEKSEQ